MLPFMENRIPKLKCWINPLTANRDKSRFKFILLSDQITDIENKMNA